jgi:hypothetical protein
MIHILWKSTSEDVVENANGNQRNNTLMIMSHQYLTFRVIPLRVGIDDTLLGFCAVVMSGFTCLFTFPQGIQAPSSKNV